MNPKQRFCKQKGHEHLPQIHICTFQKCNAKQRWCCEQCYKDGIHRHGQNRNHQYPIQEVIAQQQEEFIKLQQQLVYNHLQYSNQQTLLNQAANKECLKLNQILQNLSSFIDKQIQDIKLEQETIKFFVKNISEGMLINLDDELINIIISKQENQTIINSQPLIKQIERIANKLSQIQNHLQDNPNIWGRIVQDDKTQLLKYFIKQIDQTQECFYKSQISNNEQYLAYGGDEGILKVFDIKEDKSVLHLDIGQTIRICQFSQDSLQLFIGCSDGSVFGYNVSSGFKKIFCKQIHPNDRVLNLRIIKNKYLITSSFDYSIRITEIISRRQVFKLDDIAFAIEYDEKAGIIVSGSLNKSIILWNFGKKSIIFKKHVPYGVNQLQLTNNKQYLFSLGLDYDKTLNKWRIDLINQDLINVLEFKDRPRIENFYQINQNLLILITSLYIKIINDDGECICQVEHYSGLIATNYESIQLESGRFIHINSKNKIILAILQK